MDDDLGRAIIRSAFATAGQVCYALKRVYVARASCQAVVDSCIAAADEIRVGNGMNPAATTGPLVNEAQLKRFDAFLNDAQARGAAVTECGQWVDGTDRSGWFRLPSIVTGAGDDCDLVRCEQFGPSLPICRSVTWRKPSVGPMTRYSGSEPASGQPTGAVPVQLLSKSRPACGSSIGTISARSTARNVRRCQAERYRPRARVLRPGRLHGASGDHVTLSPSAAPVPIPFR